MSQYNFNNKRFSTVANSSGGQANSETVFTYSQEGKLVTADYSGGGVRFGKIIARLQDDTLDMVYQCMTDDLQLKAGKAIANIHYNENNKMVLFLNWEWITGGSDKGQSTYVEI